MTTNSERLISRFKTECPERFARHCGVTLSSVAAQLVEGLPPEASEDQILEAVEVLDEMCSDVEMDLELDQ